MFISFFFRQANTLQPLIQNVLSLSFIILCRADVYSWACWWARCYSAAACLFSDSLQVLQDWDYAVLQESFWGGRTGWRWVRARLYKYFPPTFLCLFSPLFSYFSVVTWGAHTYILILTSSHLLSLWTFISNTLKIFPPMAGELSLNLWLMHLLFKQIENSVVRRTSRRNMRMENKHLLFFVPYSHYWGDKPFLKSEQWPVKKMSNKLHISTHSSLLCTYMWCCDGLEAGVRDDIHFRKKGGYLSTSGLKFTIFLKTFTFDKSLQHGNN